MAELSQFRGFRPGALGFLRDLAACQDRAWFAENRAIYEAEIMAPLRALLAELSAELDRRGIPLAGDPKRSVFRIHRDTRFASDKSPFKTNAGATLSRPGFARLSPGVLYVHLAPDGCFAAAACWRPDPDALDAVREGIRVRPETWTRLESELAASGHPVAKVDATARMPRGFEDLAGSPAAEAIRARSMLVRRALAEQEIGSPGLVPVLAGFAEAALPFLRFVWQAVDAARDEAKR